MFKKILAALDLSDTHDRIFAEAIALATANSAQLMLVHVLSPFDEGYPGPIFPGADGVYPIMHQEAIDRYVQDLRMVEQQGLDLLRSLCHQSTTAGIPTEFSQNIGNPGRVICDLARNWDADLVVLGRRGRVGLSELFLGSVSNYVMHHAPCSVLTIQGKAVSDLPEATEAPSVAVC